ncbi:MAG: ComEC family competence protein [Candidatus Symbiothrix sp.]|jgi:competence protein ComEC|nr:ComEC family competence protein [Candidatus Symbiothrix sp.]
MKLLHQSPFLRPLLFLVLGIIIQFHWDISFPVVLPVFLLSIVFILLSYLPQLNKQYNFRFLFGLGFSMLLVASGIFLTKITWEKSEWRVDPATYLYEGQVLEEPVLKPKTYLCKVRIAAAEEAVCQQAVDKQVVIYIPIDSLSLRIVAGETLSFYARLEQSPPYLQKQSFAATGFIRKNNWSLEPEKKQSFSIRLQALSVRRDLLVRLQEIIPDHSSYAVAAALMFGYRNEIDKDLQQAFINIGAAHILAISGSHFSILFGMLYFMLSFIGNSRKGKLIKQFILFPLIWGFAFLTGFSPSVIRAALMLSIWGIGDAFFYKSFSLNTVAIAAFFMLLFNPLYLFDVGFQLSFLAVASIILFNPYLVRLYKSRNPMIQYTWELCCVSVSAQIGVLPVSIYYFHQIPVIFLATNICLIPLSAILLFLIPVSLLFHALLGAFPLILFPLNKALAFFISITRALDQIPYGNIYSVEPGVWGMTALFLSIVLISLILFKKRVVYVYLLLIFGLFQVIYYLC